MFTVLAASFTIPPVDNQTVQDTYARITQTVKDQIGTFVQSSNQDAALEWTSSTSWRSSDGTKSMHWEDWRHSDQEPLALTDCRLSYVVEQDPWQVELSFGTGAAGVDISAVWRTAVAPDSDYPLKKLPPLLRALSMENGYSLDLAKGYQPHVVEVENVHEFYADVLINPKRCTPIVLISPEAGTGHVLVDAERTARQLSGLALVYQFADYAAAQAFRERIGAALACYDGAVRLCWPNFNPQDRSNRRDYWTARDICGLNSLALQGLLFRLVAETSRRYFEAPDSLRHLEQQKRQDERQQREAQLARLQREAADSAEWQQMLQEAYTEREALRQDNDKLKQEKQALTTSLDELRDQLRDAKANLQAAYASYLELPDSHPNLGSLPTVEDDREVRLALHRNAWTAFREVPSNQQELFKQELCKLLDPDRRQHQSKPIKGKTDCFIFPRGHKDVRIFYYAHTDGSIRVCELVDHDTYDQLLDQGRVFKCRYADNDFTPLELFSMATTT